MEVELVHWPEGAVRLGELRAHGRARLVLVSADADPPEIIGLEEDWIRLPAAEGDMKCRMESLSRRMAEFRPVEPTLDDGVLRYGEASVVLRPLELRLVSTMLAARGKTVTRAALLDAGWPEQTPDRNLLDAQLVRIRRRLALVNVRVVTVRSRGFLLQW